MKNLPVFSQNLLKGCKVFAIASALSLCCACGGSEPAETPEGEVAASPMSGEVEVQGGEVESNSGTATADETAPEGKKADLAAAGDVVGEAVGDMVEGAKNAVEAVAEEAQPKEENNDAVSSHFMVNGKLRDPFDKFAGAPAIGTSLAGGVKPSTNRARTEVSSAYKKQLAKKAAKEAEAVVKVNKPDVKVTGILRSGNVYKAILQGPEKAIMVSSGENIGGYRIAAVTDRDVTLVYKNKYKFVIPLEKEVFGNTGAPESPAPQQNAPF